MYCNNCGKNNPKDSKFCQNCGSTIGKSTNKQSQQIKPDEKNKSNYDLLWEKFVEVYDVKEEDRKRINDLSSIFIWELIDRLSVNAFESFIKDSKEELNKQPYKTIEALKNAYAWSVTGGYKLWLAEALLDEKEELNKFNSFTLDKFIDEWKKYDFDKSMKAISEEMGICITQYTNITLNNFINSAQEVKDLSNATVEKLKTSLMFQIANGYHAGKIENSFRK